MATTINCCGHCVAVRACSVALMNVVTSWQTCSVYKVLSFHQQSREKVIKSLSNSTHNSTALVSHHLASYRRATFNDCNTLQVTNVVMNKTRNYKGIKIDSPTRNLIKKLKKSSRISSRESHCLIFLQQFLIIYQTHVERTLHQHSIYV